MLRLNCFIAVTDCSHRDTVIDAAKRLTEASLLQDGCIAYDVFTSATRPDVIMICETWRDNEGLKVHSDSEIFATEVSAMQKYAKMKLETFEF